jgi:methionyl-tRNA formyltransferase
MTKPRILFMGTPAFALPALDTLLAGSCPIIAVVTQPDRPAGRGQKEVAPPVKLLAQKSGVPVLQPKTVKDPSFLEKFYSLKPDMVVVAAFGQILPKMIIDFPPLGCLNIHPSLLPKYRGAAPLNWSIIRGEKKTGVTIMLMDEGMDSGDILAQEETLLGDEETYGQLHDRLAKDGATLLMKTIAHVASGKAQRRRQDPSSVTFAPRLTRETCNINWQESAVHIVNLIRGLCPSPAAYTFWEGQLLKIYTAVAETGQADQAPGTIGTAVANGLPVAASDGLVILKDIQLAGKKRMPINDFLRGYRPAPGSLLGSAGSK